MVGKIISHYRILDKIGEGGMGVVYKAEDTRLDRVVALKFLSSHLLESDEARERFVHEAKAAATLDHPNICTVHEIDETDGETFLAMAYIEGPTLKQKIDERPLKLKQALDIATEIAEGLAAAHERGIIHRDIKPANLMLGADGHVKIMDFGLAHLGGRTKITKTGVVLGTPAYMAPEQLRGEQTDGRADIWSVGVVLHEMVTGRPPFEGETEETLSYAILHVEPEPLTALRSGVPPDLDRIVAKSLAKDPGERYQHIDEALVDLRALRKRLPESASRREETTASGLVRRLGVQWRLALGLAAALVLALAAMVAFWLGRFSSGPGSTSRQVSRLVVKLSEGYIPAGSAGSLALSPDGSKLVYSALRGGAQRLYLRRLDQFQASPIPGTEGGSCPFFSPDGNWVGFFARDNLKKVSLAGDAPLTLCETKSNALAGGSWALDGMIVFGPGLPFGLMRVSASGGAPEALTKPDPKQGEVAHIWPQVLPSGKGVLFTIYRAGLGFGEHPIAVLPLKGGERHVLSRDFTFARYAETGDLICYRDGSVAALPFDAERLKVTGPPVSLLEGVGRSVLYAPLLDLSSSGSLVFVPDDVRTRTFRLVWVNQAGNVQPLQAPEQQVSFPALSPDGRLLAMTIRNQQGSHIWIWDLLRDALGRVTYDRSNHAPIWSPDGQWVVFSSDQEGPEANLYRKRADGTGRTERLLSSVNHQDPGSFSPDGKSLAFGEFCGEGKWDIWVLAMDGGHVARPFLQTRFDEMEPMISPDGRWVAYSSDESGRSEIYVQPFPQRGRKWQVSSEGADQPLWAPDGRRLFFRTPDSVMEIAIETQPEFRLGKQRALFSGRYRGRSGYGHPSYDISRDGQRFLMLQPSLPEGEGATEINVILNWSEELRRLVRSQNRTGK